MWTATNADSATSRRDYVGDPTCSGTSGDQWGANSLSGGVAHWTLLPCEGGSSGVTYTLTYTVTQAATGKTSVAYVRVLPYISDAGVTCEQTWIVGTPNQVVCGTDLRNCQCTPSGWAALGTPCSWVGAPRRRSTSFPARTVALGGQRLDSDEALVTRRKLLRILEEDATVVNHRLVFPRVSEIPRWSVIASNRNPPAALGRGKKAKTGSEE
jgi:hypothetical protein